MAVAVVVAVALVAVVVMVAATAVAVAMGAVVAVVVVAVLILTVVLVSHPMTAPPMLPQVSAGRPSTYKTPWRGVSTPPRVRAKPGMRVTAQL